MPHVTSANVIPVMLAYDVFLWDSDWAEHYFNALAFWNDNLGNSVLHDVTVIEDARIWFVRPGGDDEAFINEFVASQGAVFEPGANCTAGGPGAWATLNPAKPILYSGHWHYEFQKVCLWGGAVPVAPKNLTQEGDHRWWLTILHELGHAFSMDHSLPGQCVMLSGYSMVAPCTNEIEWVNQHYGL